MIDVLGKVSCTILPDGSLPVNIKGVGLQSAGKEILAVSKGYRSSVWISIEQSVMVSSVVRVLMGFVVCEFINYGWAPLRH